MEEGKEKEPTGRVAAGIATEAVGEMDEDEVEEGRVEEPEGIGADAKCIDEGGEGDQGAGVAKGDGGCQGGIEHRGHVVAGAGIVAAEIPAERVKVGELPAVEEGAEGETTGGEDAAIGSDVADDGGDGADDRADPGVGDAGALEGGVGARVEENVGGGEEGGQAASRERQRRDAQPACQGGKEEGVEGGKGVDGEGPQARPGHLTVKGSLKPLIKGGGGEGAEGHAPHGAEEEREGGRMGGGVEAGHRGDHHQGRQLELGQLRIQPRQLAQTMAQRDDRLPGFFRSGGWRRQRSIPCWRGKRPSAVPKDGHWRPHTTTEQRGGPQTRPTLQHPGRPSALPGTRRRRPNLARVLMLSDPQATNLGSRAGRPAPGGPPCAPGVGRDGAQSRLSGRRRPSAGPEQC